MRHIFLAMLGTSKYIPCHYKIGNFISEITPFVEEALINFFCKDWDKNDLICIFCTKEAETKNWCDNGNFDEGLYSRLKKLNLKASIKKVSIPEGKSEDEVMEIFTTMVNQLSKGDKVILDITHSFRSIPFLSSAVLNYSKVIKEIQVEGIYYGAMEAVGSPDEVKKIAEEERIIPIFDLTPFDYLLNWSFAVDTFIKTGRAEEIKKLLSEKVNPILKGDSPNKPLAKKLRKFGDRLASFCNNLVAVRGKEIDKEDFNFLNVLDELSLQTLIPPMNPLIQLLKEKLSSFKSSDILGLEAAKWCIEHQMTPQAYIFLLETVITELCKVHKNDPSDRSERDFWSGLLHIIASKKDEQEWDKEVKKQAERAKKILAEELYELKELAEAIPGLRDYRNDFMHGGWRKDPAKANKLLDRVKTQYEKVSHAIREYKKKLLKKVDKTKKAIFLVSHAPTLEQKEQLKEKWGINNLIIPPEEIQKIWASIPPDISSVNQWIEPIINWLSDVCSSGDIIVVQGDYGATFIVVNWAKKKGCVPVYATTQRILEEEKKEDGSVIQKRIFKHSCFRKYE